MRGIFLVCLVIISESQIPNIVVPKLANQNIQPTFRVSNNLQTSTNNTGVVFNPNNSTYQIHLASTPTNGELIELVHTSNSTYGMRFDSPIPILISVNFSSTSPLQRSYSLRVNVYYQQNGQQKLVLIYLASQIFNLPPVNPLKIQERANYNFTRVEGNIVKIFNSSSTFIGTINITDFLHYFIRQTNSFSKINSNMTVSSISHTITINGGNNVSNDIIFFSAYAHQLERNNTYHNTSLRVQNYLLFHDVPLGLSEREYANLTTVLDPILYFNNLSFSSSITQAKASNSQILISPHTDDYIAIGFVRGQNITATGQYGLPLAINSSQSILSNFTFQNQKLQDSLIAVCFTLLLRSNTDVLAYNLSFPNSNAKTIQICPLRNINFLDGEFNSSLSTQFRLFNFSNSTFIFQLTPPITKIVNLNLTKYVKIISSYLPQLLDYWIVGIKAGFQVHYGWAKFQFTSLQFGISNGTEVVPLNFLPLLFPERTQDTDNFSCPLGSLYDTPSSSCKMNPDVNRIVSPIIAVPNVGLLLKIGPFIGTVDDLSYFVYHNQNYDRVFKYFSEVAWNWTNSKWQPFLFPVQISSSTVGYSKKWIKDTQKITPVRLKWINEDTFFLNNCQGFLFYTIPVSFLSFIVLWILQKKFGRSHPKVTALLISFSSWAYLIISLFGENLQYLAFRCFEQFRYFVPNRGILSLISITLALIFNFLAIFIAGATYFLALKWANQKFLPILLQKHQKACFFFGIWMLAKFSLGVVHAFIDDSFVRLSCLVLIQTLIAFTSVCSGQFARYKFSLTFMVFGQIVRFLLYLVALFEVIYPKSVSVVRNHLLMIDLSYTLIICLYIANGLQIIFHLLIGILMKRQVNVQTQQALPQSSAGHSIQENKHSKRKTSCITKRKTQKNIEIQFIRDADREKFFNKAKTVKPKKQQSQPKVEIILPGQTTVRQFDQSSSAVVQMLKHKQYRLKLLAKFEYEKKQKQKLKAQNSKFYKTSQSVKSVQKDKKQLQLLRKS